ncbi:MAG: phosphoribosylglycinamide formyltransferase [Sideroxydans sp.]|nr:phosphoribosylglycinamide formyltransferase [Sideroxydans sp.]
MKRKPRSFKPAVESIVVLISGRGSNLHSILKNCPCRVAAVISNRADAEGLQVAAAHHIPTAVVSHKDYPDRASFDAVLAETIDSYRPELVVLAGFMRILTPEFVDHYRGRMINIHPSLLPAYAGLNTHARAIADGVKIHGCTVHYVTSDLDHGPIIIQAAVPVLKHDTPDTLAARVLREEHRIYPQAIRWICKHHVELNAAGKVHFKRLEQPGPALIFPSLD